MPILNYTTDISTERTIAQISTMLAKAGAASIRIDYEDGEPTSLSFLLMLAGQPAPFRLPIHWQGVHRLLQNERPAAHVGAKIRTEAHARRVAWRIVKDWVEAQLAFIQSGQASLPQLFLPHAVRADGRTLFEVVAADPRLLLGSGDEEDPPAKQ